MHSWSKSPFYTSKDAGSKENCMKDILFSVLSSPKAKGETASLSFDSSFGFPRITVGGENPTFFSLQMKEKIREKNTFSLCEIRKWRMHSILWVHRIKHKVALSWHIFRWQETLGIVGASEHNESNPNTNQGSLLAKPIGEGIKDGTCKVDRAPVV
ncbi:ribosomal protein L2 [Capsicum galapagoense]